PLGMPAAQLALARALRGDDRNATAMLSATTFRNRIVSEPAMVRALWAVVDVLVCNAEEAELLVGQTRLPPALERISAAIRTGRRGDAVCVTDGAAGAYVVTETGALPVEAFPTPVVDPTGAGECF